VAIDPITLGLSTAASVGGQLLKSKAANQDYLNQLALQQQQTANDIGEAGAKTAFGNDFLKGYGTKYGTIADRNYANENARLTSRLGAIQPTVSAFAAPAQETERAGLEGTRFGAAGAAMGPAQTSAAIPLKAGMGQGATATEYDKRFAKSAAAGTDKAARTAKLGSWDDIWNRNALRLGETDRGLNMAEAFGKGRADVINQANVTNNRSLTALPALQELVGVGARKPPINAPAPTNTSLAQILGGLGNLGGAVAGSGGFPNLGIANYFSAPTGRSVVPRPSLFG
jgi:hypothetical protein